MSVRRAALQGCLIALALTTTIHAQTAVGTTTVTGRVVAEASSQPVRRAYVIVHGAATRTTRVTMSDLEGTFTFEGLPPDRYRVGASKRPHKSAAVDVTSDPIVITLPAAEAEAPPMPAAPTLPPEPRQVPGQPPVAQGNGVVAGVVVDERSGLPLSNAPVVHRSSGRRVLTDAEGRFRIDGLGAMTYSFLVEGGGFQPASSAEVTLSHDAVITDVTLRASRSGSISGAVRDDAGDPIVGMPVVAYRKQALNLQPVLMARGSSRTDRRGLFQINGLPPGDYLLCACAGEPFAIDPRLLELLGPTAPGAAEVSRLIDHTVQTFAPTFFPGLARASDSPVVTVESGDDRAGMDITMYGVKPYSISGRLLQSGGPASQRMQVFLGQDGDLPGAIGVSAMMPVELTADGRFRFAGVPPGTYSVNATPAAAGYRTPWGHRGVTVVDRDIENLAVPIGHGVSVTGRVEFFGSAARPPADRLQKARVSLAPLDFSMAMLASMGNSGSVGHGATLDAEGRFVLEGVPAGRYLVRVTVPDSPWRTVQRITAPDADVQDDILIVGANDAIDVVIGMTDAPLATVTGTVTLGRYDSPGATRVVVFPIDDTRWLQPERYSRQFQFVFVNRDRSFRMADLPGGDYYIALVSTFGFEMSAGKLERWAKTAQRVTLKAGQVTTVRFSP